MPTKAEVKQTWSIIIPCYNEEGNIRKTVNNSVQVLEEIASDYEILLFNDGSTDQTLSILNEIAGKIPKVRVFNHETNKGLGTVLRNGYFEARMENVISIPGDGQFDPEELKKVVPIPQGTIVAFYRKENLTYSFFRNKLSFVHKKLNELLIGLDLKDVNWTIVFKRNAFEALNLRLKSTLIKSEICAKMIYLGYEVREYPSVYHSREHGESKGSSRKIIFQAARDVFKLAYTVLLFKLTNKRKYS